MKEGKKDGRDLHKRRKKASWKRIADEYGTNYCEDLKSFVRNECKRYDSITSEDGMIDIFI